VESARENTRTDWILSICVIVWRSSFLPVLWLTAQPTFVRGRVSKLVTDGSKTVVIDIMGFLCTTR
jgi:hypothetical protein